MSNLPYGYRYEMRRTLRFGQWETRYVVEGAIGACEFWVRENHPIVHEPGQSKFSAGFETHDTRPSGNKPPDHGNGCCWALSGRACWHDGSSTYGMEHWLPRWERDPDHHEAVFLRLVGEVQDRFEPKKEDANV